MTSLSNQYEIDKRTGKDILDQIRKLAASYVPEWQFDEENPDMGSVIAFLYAEQMEDNLKRYNTVLERYYTELANMLGISLKPAHPARSTVLLSLVEDTLPGMQLPKGTKLSGGAEEDRNLVFETVHPVYLTQSRLLAAFMTDGKNGKVIPVLGKFPPVEDVNAPTQALGFPIRLFDFQKEGYGRHALLLYHSHIPDVEGSPISLHMPGGREALDGVMEGRFGLYCYGEKGFFQITELYREDAELLSFVKAEKCQKTQVDDREYCLLVLETGEAPEHTVYAEDIRLSSVGRPVPPQVIWNGIHELTGERFAPFGDTVNLFSELYLGHASYFGKPGAQITISFQVSYEENVTGISRQAEDEELKIIKRKPKKIVTETPAEVYVDEISLEYFNGTGWKELKTDKQLQAVFAGGEAGRIRFSFIAPSDWAETEAGGYMGRSIRIRVIRSDNCYYRPSVHHYPVISECTLSYTYRHKEEQPERLFSLCGGQKKDLGRLLEARKPLPVFRRNGYGTTALYLGFDAAMESGPVSLLFRLEEGLPYHEGRTGAYYSTREGFARLQIADSTEGFSHTGMIQFLPPSDMAKRVLEGQEAYWIKFEDEEGIWTGDGEPLPLLLGVDVNGVEVSNIETLPEEEFYMDASESNMSFALNAGNILSAEVWVNEKGSFGEDAMRRLLKEDGRRVRAEYDFLGEITGFYVKWEEVDTFDLSQGGDRHYCLDRMNGRLHFGDGVHVQIPRNVQGPAFKVILRCCNGEEGNLPEGKITGSMGNLMFVDRITNPIRAYGGSNMEAMENALRRGTVLIGGRKRLVSVWDYEREVLCFSSGISKVKAVTGWKREGRRDDSCISLVVLMEDYRNGSASFHHLKERLTEHLLQRCELTVNGDRLEIMEPVFAEVSLDIWLSVQDVRDIFSIQERLLKALANFFDPTGSEGWEIGQLPERTRIELKVLMEKGESVLKHIMITVSYRDSEGRIVECDIDELEQNPFLAVRNGAHRIHFDKK